MKKRYFAYLGIYILILFLIVTTILTLAINIAKEKEVIDVNKEIEEKRELPKYVTKNIFEEKDNVTINLNLPHTNSKKFNDKIEVIKNKYLGYIKEEENSKNNDTNLDLNMTYTVNKYNDNILSFVIHTEIYLGGAHPNAYIDTVTYDFKKDKEIYLKDLFGENNTYLNKISQIAKEKLLKEEKIKMYYNKDILENGLIPIEENFKRFALDNNCIIFFFERYQVAPYVAGEFNVCIELEKLNFNSKLL